MPVLETRHDHAHPVEDDSAWSESYYFNAYDPVNDMGFFSRVGVRPNEGTIDAGLSVWLPGGGLAHLHEVREERGMPDGLLRVGSIQYELVEEGRSWRIRATGEAAGHEIAVDATFTALTPMIGVDAQGKQQASEEASHTRGSLGAGHLEQAGTWKGWIDVDGRAESLAAARGNRDKSWGPRRGDGSGTRMWRWFSINIGDDLHLGGIRVGTDKGELHRGWIWADGEATSVRRWELHTETEADGITQKAIDLVVHDKRERAWPIRAELLRVARIDRAFGAGRTSVFEGLARFTHDGRVGYGIAEYLHQFGDDGSPVIPIE